MSILDVNKNIDLVKPNRLYKLNQLFNQMRTGAIVIAEDIFKIGSDTVYVACGDITDKLVADTNIDTSTTSCWKVIMAKMDRSKESGWEIMYEGCTCVFTTDTLEKFYDRFMDSIPMEKWNEWKTKKSDFRKLFINLFEMTKEEVKFYDWRGSLSVHKK